MNALADIPIPTDSDLSALYRSIGTDLDAAGDSAAWRAAFARWDEARRIWRSYASFVRLRYAQDTASAERREAQAELDRRTPTFTALDDTLKRRFLASPHRAALEAEFGPQAFALWDADVAAFDPAIADDLVRESNLVRAYTELLSNATVMFDGQERSLGGLDPYLRSRDRSVRYAAERARWEAFALRADRLDDIFDQLVRVRDRMARTLGFANYVELGYKRMHRIDFDQADVATYRAEIAKTVVPFAAELIAKGGRRAGLDRVMFWDEASLGTSVAPGGDSAWVLERTREAFAALDPALGEFAAFLLDAQLLDVDNRKGKALGAFCTQFPTPRLPFVFANFNGSYGDIRTLTHEFGHAFSAYRSRAKQLVDYITPTYESAEIHSMSLEYFAWPEMERYFGDGADAYRQDHLRDAMLFLPYAAAVDEFQHLVYATPSATPAERNAMWRELEARYMPWRDYGDLGHPLAGGLWQEKRHIYNAPFYYIDYALASCCALQFWVRAQADRPKALADYVALCGRGGEAAFGELVRSAGLQSPFSAGVLEGVVTAASATF
jgi:M3 family oligoendopeptidase